MRVRRIAIAIAFVAACGDDASVPAVPVVSGDAQVTLSDDGATLVFSRAGTTLLTFGSDSFQAGTVDDLDSGASFDPYWQFVDPPNIPSTLVWRALEPGPRMRVVASSADALELQLRYPGATGTVSVARAADGCFDIKLSATLDSQSVAFLRVRPDADAGEGFYGLGEWGDSAEHRGKLRPMQIEADLDFESGDDENHVPVPLLIGTHGWGMFVESDRP